MRKLGAHFRPWVMLVVLLVVLLFSVEAQQREPRGHLLQMDRFHGRVGNNLAQLGHVLVLADRSGAGRISLHEAKQRHEPTKAEAQNKEDLRQLFNLPDNIRLHGRPSRSQLSLPKECDSWRVRGLRHRDGSFHDPWYATPCSNVSAEQYHESLVIYVQPLLSAELASCIASEVEEDDGSLLTVHLRGDDLWPVTESGWDQKANGRIWLFPPCAMYEKIIIDGSFTRVRVVTSHDKKHPCVPWFKELRQRHRIQVHVQSGSIVEDTCAVLSAQYLAISYSSYGHNLAVLSTNARQIYTRGAFDPHWLLDCDAWPGTTVTRYDVSVQDVHASSNDTFRGAVEWMQSFPLKKVQGPLACRREDCRGRREHSPLLCDADLRAEL